MAQQLPVGQRLSTIVVSRSYSDTTRLVRYLCTSDQPDAETSTWQNTTLKRDRHPCSQLDSNLQSQEMINCRSTP